MSYRNVLAISQVGGSKHSILTIFIAAAVVMMIFFGRFARAEYVLSTIATFDETNGANPHASLVIGANGNLYSTTIGGGTNHVGTVFELDATTHALTTIASFNVTNGSAPGGEVLFDASGNIYGTTSIGGVPQNAGTVFMIDATTHALTTLVTFNGANGKNPYGGLIADSVGNLYGTTGSGGANNAGTVFEIDATTHALTTIVTFDGTNGSGPLSSLIADPSGNFYGTTAGGGAYGVGTVFMIDATTHALTTLASFDVTNGGYPHASLVMDASGNLYGTTQYRGDYNAGTVFMIDATTHALTTLVMFDGTNGKGPIGGLILDADGNLFGTTPLGGDYDFGTVFKIDATTHELTTIATFDGVNGSAPLAALVMDASGNLYGTTEGGDENIGTVFQLTPVVVPELSTFALGGLGLITVLFAGVRKYRTLQPVTTR